MLPLELVELVPDRLLAALPVGEVNRHTDKEIDPRFVNIRHIHGGHDRPAMYLVDQPRDCEIVEAVVVRLASLRQGIQRGVQPFFWRFLCCASISTERFLSHW